MLNFVSSVRQCPSCRRPCGDDHLTGRKRIAEGYVSVRVREDGDEDGDADCVVDRGTSSASWRIPVAFGLPVPTCYTSCRHASSAFVFRVTGSPGRGVAPKSTRASAECSFLIHSLRRLHVLDFHTKCSFEAVLRPWREDGRRHASDPRIGLRLIRPW